MPVHYDDAVVGSSPLARGLLMARREGRTVRRIIPARAGFTTPAIPPAATCTDHPRSRGVYADDMAEFLKEVGSSPLARGLRQADQSH